LNKVPDVVAWLHRNASRTVRDGMARYGLPSDHALGISVGALKAHAKQLGRDHALATALWKTGIYEARLLASFVGEPDKLTVAQMNAWCRDFDNWGICDTVCFALFDRTPLAWGRLTPWSRAKGEFQKRAAFALLASLALHDKTSPDTKFAPYLAHIEAAAPDDRNFVKKGVVWALRAVGLRSAALQKDALTLARRLAASDVASERWIGREVVRELSKKRVKR
jgi:3-methyladenine DNA glycosylase AlkD